MSPDDKEALMHSIDMFGLACWWTGLTMGFMASRIISAWRNRKCLKK